MTEQVAEHIGPLMKRLRGKMRKSQAVLAVRVNEISGATLTRWDISRYENGRRIPYVHLPALAIALGADLADLEAACDAAQAARAARTSQAVPAAQDDQPTVEFAGDEGSGDDEWERMAELLRRTFLKRGIAAFTLPAIGLDELKHIVAALENARRYTDGAVVGYFSRQLDDCASRDRVGGPAGTIPEVLGLIAAMEQMARDAKPGVRLEVLRTLARAAELAGWFYRDLAAAEPAGYWRDRAMEWAQAAADPAMQGYVLLKKSQAAWDERDGLRMLSLAQAVKDGPWGLPYRVQAEASQQVARGQAMLGEDFSAVDTELGRARELLSRDGSRDDLSPHYSAALFELQVANCLCLVERPHQALAVYERWLSLKTFSRRDYGYFLSSKATAYAQAGDADVAASTGIEALTIARETSSARTHAAVLRLTGELRPEWHRPMVRELRHAVTA